MSKSEQTSHVECIEAVEYLRIADFRRIPFAPMFPYKCKTQFIIIFIEITAGQQARETRETIQFFDAQYTESGR